MKLKEFSSEEIFIFFFPLAAARSVTRLGDFWKFLATKILAKEAQMIGNFLGYLEKPYSYVKTALAGYFLHIFWKKLGYFLLQHLVTLGGDDRVTKIYRGGERILIRDAHD